MNRLSRRTVLQQGVLAAAGGLVAHGPAQGAPDARSKPKSNANAGAKAKAVIQIWMWGGPCHLDTFDPKPEAGNDYAGPLNHPIKTNVDGLRVGELLPELAKQADKYSVIRSMTHHVNAHETASYIVQTGRMAGERLVYPSVGAVVTLFKSGPSSQNLLPPYLVLTEPQGRFSEAGFLGTRYKPFATGGDPAQKPFAVEGITAEGISDQRQQDRRELLAGLNTLAHDLPGHPQVTALEERQKQAYELILGEGGKVFDVSREKEALRNRYGQNTFGQACLVARRLVERGVRFVTINYKGWDTHKQHFQIMRRKLPEMDKGLATLLADLKDHGLLESTIVWWSGEFGRTPKIQWEPPFSGGRGHWGNAFSALVAGGGFQGGRVIGSTDAKGEAVKNRPVYPCDLIASMYRLLGIDPEGTLPTPLGQPVRVTPSATDGVPQAGWLKELV